MHISKFLHNFFSKSLFYIHTKRQQALLNAVSSLLLGKKLSLTQLGRSMKGKAKERHCIRKLDRLLGNTKLSHEKTHYYREINRLSFSHIERPLINIDWTVIDRKLGLSVLRASVAIKGRGLVAYEKTFAQLENSPKAESQFLLELKEVLPKGCKAILVTDAGFKVPWFKKVTRLGFDYVGRVRMDAYYQRYHETGVWLKCKDLYKKATSNAKYVGQALLTKEHKFETALVIYKGKKKNRKHLNSSGVPYSGTEEKRSAQATKDPFLIVTSLEVGEVGAEKVIKIYKKRMQIEEEFRDLKSSKYGFSMEDCRSKTPERIDILLLIAAIASFGCWIMALAAHKTNLHLDYHANSKKKTNILSVCYLACQLVRKKVSFKKVLLYEALKELTGLIGEACYA